jgi:molybdopterin-synthase adenylyltransferase
MTARIAVLGLGGVGSNVAANLLGSEHISEMLLVDFDRVELSNLSRQVTYREADVGRLKAEVAAERFRSVSSNTTIETLEAQLTSQAAIERVIQGYDLVMAGIDTPLYTADEWLNTACFSLGIPYMSMNLLGAAARIGPLFVPGETGCHGCEEIAARREYPLYDVVVDQFRGVPSPTALVGPACLFAAAVTAIQIEQFLAGEEPTTLGASLTFELPSMEFKREVVPKEPECEICGAPLDTELEVVG